jgi:hypothetical protein
MIRTTWSRGGSAGSRHPVADLAREAFVGPDEDLEKLALHALAVLDRWPDGTLTRVEIEQLALAALASLGIPVAQTAVSE